MVALKADNDGGLLPAILTAYQWETAAIPARMVLGGQNGAHRLATLTSEVPIDRLSVDDYAKQPCAEGARICREQDGRDDGFTYSVGGQNPST